MIRVDFSSCVAPPKPVRGSQAQRAGVYYERAVTGWFAARFLIAPQPTLLPMRKRPDLLVFEPGCAECVVVEIKRQYVETAQEQVREYARLVSQALPFLRVRTLVVCGQLLRLEPNLRVVSPDEVFSLQSGASSVLVLSKRELRLGATDGSDYLRGTASTPVRKLGSPGNVVSVLHGLRGVVA